MSNVMSHVMSNAMSDPAHALTLQFLAWVAEDRRTYAQAMDAWRSSCPRLSIWEDAILDGLVAFENGMHLCVGHAASGADDTLGYFIAGHVAAGVDVHEARQDQTVFVGAEAAYIG